MPYKDGTGPEGKGPKTGRGMGLCGQSDATNATNAPVSRGMGQGMGRGAGRGAGQGARQGRRGLFGLFGRGRNA